MFERVTRERDSKLIPVADRFKWEIGSSSVLGQEITLTGAERTYHLATPLLGDYQSENVATAVAAIETLVEKGYDIPVEAIEAGTRKVSWPGRFEIFTIAGKTVIVDGAHNPYSISRLVESLRKYVSFEDTVLVYGASGGHSAEGMLAELSSLRPKVIAAHSRHPRSSHSMEVFCLDIQK